MGHAMRESTKAKIRATLKRKKEEKLKLTENMNAAPTDSIFGLQQAGIQTPKVDVEYLQERAYRRGLFTALESILREL